MAVVDTDKSSENIKDGTFIGFFQQIIASREVGFG